MQTAADSAKQFLVSRIADQAILEGVALSAAEVRALEFSEAHATPEELAQAAEFDREQDTGQFESRIAALIQAVYERDVQRGEKPAWDRALDDLADEDIYLQVMLEKAGLVKTTTFLVLPDWRLLWAVVPMLVCILLALGVAFLPWAARIIPNNLLRLGLCISILAAPLLYRKLRRNRLPPGTV